MKKEITCIICPNGCEMEIEMQDNKLNVQGAQCKRGHEYAEEEFINPMRTISTSVLVLNGELPLVPVRLNRPIPKNQIFEAMKEIKAIRLEAPVSIGDVALMNICGCKSDVVITKNIKRA